MPHTSQKIRGENIEVTAQIIAKTMPKGAREPQLLAILSLKPYGFHPRTIKGYLKTLEDAGRIVKTGDRWKLPSVKEKKEA